jgi:serine phosphatase RsbU (regulator of sigma subunit)
VFLVIAIVNLVLLVVLGVLVVQIRGFVREAEKNFGEQREKILHPLLDFDQIRSIPSARDIEMLILSVALQFILYFVAVIEKENLAERYAHWWVTLEVGSVLVFCHAMLRYSRHLVDRDQADWHRAYAQTRDFLFFRIVATVLIGGIAAWMFFGLPSTQLDTGLNPAALQTFNAGDDLIRETPDTAEEILQRERLEPYRGPIFTLRTIALLLFLYFLQWVLRLRGELVALMKSIGLLLALAAIIGWWMIAFKFNPDPTYWPVAQGWAFSEWTHVCYTGVFLSLILLLFKDNMVLLGATHNAAQVIADEKRVMVDFLVRVAEDPSSFDREKGGRRLRQDLDHILNLTLEFSMRQSNAKAGAVYLLDTVLQGAGINGQPGRHLIPRVVEGLYPPLQPLSIDYLATRIKYINELFLTETVNLDRYPFFDQLMKRGDLLYLPNTQGHTEIPQQPTDFLRINSLIAVPLRVQEQDLGLLVVINKLSEGEREWEEFTPQDASLLNAVADQASIAIANARMHEVIDEQERLEREIEIARRVQESLLPERFPEISGYNISAFSRAARQIGGDYYDFVWMDDHRLAIVVADVAGKGIPGALTMATLRSALRALVKQTRGAKELAIVLNDFIFEDLKRDVFISVTLGVLDIHSNRIDLIRAGHEPIILTSRQGKSTEQFIPDGIAMGIDRGSLFRESLEEFTYEMEPGDLIFLYTDGVTEAMNQKREEYTHERLVRLLEDHRDKDVNALFEVLREDLREFTGDSPPHDDVTVVAIQKL